MRSSTDADVQVLSEFLDPDISTLTKDYEQIWDI